MKKKNTTAGTPTATGPAGIPRLRGLAKNRIDPNDAGMVTMIPDQKVVERSGSEDAVNLSATNETTAVAGALQYGRRR